MSSGLVVLWTVLGASPVVPAAPPTTASIIRLTPQPKPEPLRGDAEAPRSQVELPVPPLAPLRPPRRKPRFAQRVLVFTPVGQSTPLLLAFSPDGHAALGPEQGTFEFKPGAPSSSAWPRAETPWLVRDLNRDGRIDSGRELLGSFTVVEGRLAKDGFAALAALDQNHDGVVDAADPAFASLALWRDDGDRRVQPGELVPLSAAGVTALATTAHPGQVCDEGGNCELLRGEFTWRDPRGATHRGSLIDITLQLTPAAPR